MGEPAMEKRVGNLPDSKWEIVVIYRGETQKFVWVYMAVESLAGMQGGERCP